MEGASSSSGVQPANLKVGGAWTGIIEVQLQNWTVSVLRAELAMRSKCLPENINIICAGRILKHEDGDKKLTEVGLRSNSKVLISKVVVDQLKALEDEHKAENERSCRLARIKAAVDAMAKRHTENSFPIDNFNIEVENQSGQKLNVGSETDQRALVMGLMLHAKGRHFIKSGQYREALDILGMGEEAFQICDRKVLEMVDNVPLLQIDTVWCYFMLRDVSCLAMAGLRLKEARSGLEHSHGANLERVRVLQGGFCPELAIYIRLELLEGIVAYYRGSFEESRKALRSAQNKYQQLQVSDEALAFLKGMGYTEQESRRALRMSGQDVQRAVDFVITERERNFQRMKEDRQRQKEIREQISYGRTPLGKPVDLIKLKQLVSIGYERLLVAEALRKNENDTQKALDDLIDPNINSALQYAIDSRRQKRQRSAWEKDIKDVMSMGFERERVVAAFRHSGSKEQAIEFLLGGVSSDPAALTSGVNGSEVHNGLDSVASKGNEEQMDLSNTIIDQMEDDAEYPDRNNNAQIRDTDAEEDLTKNLTGDPLADYDIEVEKEGEAIEEYLNMLESAQ